MAHRTAFNFSRLISARREKDIAREATTSFSYGEPPSTAAAEQSIFSITRRLVQGAIRGGEASEPAMTTAAAAAPLLDNAGTKQDDTVASTAGQSVPGLHKRKNSPHMSSDIDIEAHIYDSREIRR